MRCQFTWFLIQYLLRTSVCLALCWILGIQSGEGIDCVSRELGSQKLEIHIETMVDVFPVIGACTESVKAGKTDGFLLPWGLGRVRKSLWRRTPMSRAWSILGRANRAEVWQDWLDWDLQMVLWSCRQRARECRAGLSRPEESLVLRSGLCWEAVLSRG